MSDSSVPKTLILHNIKDYYYDYSYDIILNHIYIWVIYLLNSFFWWAFPAMLTHFVGYLLNKAFKFGFYTAFDLNTKCMSQTTDELLI